MRRQHDKHVCGCLPEGFNGVHACFVLTTMMNGRYLGLDLPELLGAAWPSPPCASVLLDRGQLGFFLPFFTVYHKNLSHMHQQCRGCVPQAQLHSDF